MITKTFRSTSKLIQQSLYRTSIQIRSFADGVSAEVNREGWESKGLPTLQEGETVPEFFNFTLSCPHKELYQDAPVRMVGVPGSAGRFAATPGHIPVICEMQPGILSLYHERSETAGRQDSYFVSGGICMIHPNGDMEISTPECVNIQDIDPNNVRDGLAKAKDKMSKATEEKDKLEAEIEIETFETLEKCLGAGAQ